MSGRYLAISGLGSDRRGLVADATAYIKERGGNIEDSRMAILGAEFGILLLVSGSADSIARITAELPGLEEILGLTLVAKQTRSPSEHRSGRSLPCTVIASALDHEGLVHGIALGLSQMGIDIVSLETACYPAPVTGTPLFRFTAHVELPPNVSLHVLRKHMAQLASEQGLDIDVRGAATEASPRR